MNNQPGLPPRGTLDAIELAVNETIEREKFIGIHAVDVRRELAVKWLEQPSPHDSLFARIGWSLARWLLRR